MVGNTQPVKAGRNTATRRVTDHVYKHVIALALPTDTGAAANALKLSRGWRYCTNKIKGNNYCPVVY